MPSTAKHQNSASPNFDPNKFLTWEKEYWFWCDIYWFVEDSQLLSITSLGATPMLKKYLMTFMRCTRESPESRTLVNLAQLMQEQFSASIKEREMSYLDEMLSLKRESSELAQAFWYRYGELVYQLEGNSILTPGNMLFLRLLRALNVPNHIRLAIIARLDCTGGKHDVKT